VIVRLLLDSHIFLIITSRAWDDAPASYRRVLLDEDNHHFLSVASLWELALKARLGKLTLEVAPEELPQVALDFGIFLLAVSPQHAVHRLSPLPETNDPFDRMLLAQCQVEGLQLVTFDRKLVDHPLAWRPAA
jgi:PIN domain nuclease of toxin-antitoxin system